MCVLCFGTCCCNKPWAASCPIRAFPRQAGRESEVQAPQGGNAAGQATGSSPGGLPVVLRLSLQEGEGALQGPGGLEAQGIHHVDQVI